MITWYALPGGFRVKHLPRWVDDHAFAMRCNRLISRMQPSVPAHIQQCCGTCLFSGLVDGTVTPAMRQDLQDAVDAAWARAYAAQADA